MSSRISCVFLGAALCCSPLFADRVDIGWTNNVPSSWFDGTNWSTGYAPGSEEDPTPNASYAYLAGSHVDVILDGADGTLSPISILGMYDQAKLTIKDTLLEINGDENILNIWRGSVLTLDNATLKTVNSIDLQDMDGEGTILLAKNGSKLEISSNNFDINGATLHLQSGSTLDAQRNGDLYFSSTRADGGKVIFEGAGSGITNWGDNSNRAVWIGGGATEVIFKDTTFDGLVASATTVKSGGFTFDNTVVDTKTTNGAFFYGDATINGSETFALTFKNGSHLNANGKAINAGLSGDGGMWQFNLTGGSITENLVLNLASAVAFKASNAKMQVNVSEGSQLVGSSFSGGQNITGENSVFEINLSGEGSRINFQDMNLTNAQVNVSSGSQLIGSRFNGGHDITGENSVLELNISGAGSRVYFRDMKLTNTQINLRDVDNDAIHIDSAIYLEAGTKVHITLADRNADVDAPIIFGFHVGEETNPEFIIDFSELTLSEGTYKFVIFGYQGDYHPSTTDFAFDFIFGEKSGFSEDGLDGVQFDGNNWIVWAYTTGYVPEPATYAVIFALLALSFAVLKRRKQ